MRTTGLRSLRDPRTLKEFVRNLKEGVYITTLSGTILDANPAFLAMLGVESLEALQDVGARGLIVHPEQRAQELEILAREGAVREYELQIRCPDGTVRTVLDTAYQVTDPDTREVLYHGILVDISERKELESKLHQMAVRDALTGCYNRRFLTESAHRLTLEEGTWGAIVADIDHFKDYNDRYGHDVGDQVLVKVARFLMLEVRTEDEVYRIGGDEFLVVLPGSGGLAAPEIARRLRLRGPASTSVSISLGWAVRDEDEPMEHTIRRADRNLLASRARRRAPARGRPTRP